jgi:hypothetical protein
LVYLFGPLILWWCRNAGLPRADHVGRVFQLQVTFPGSFDQPDARQDGPVFSILRSSEKGYTPARQREGWLRSGVFSRSFRLTHERDERRNPEYALGVRS